MVPQIGSSKFVWLQLQWIPLSLMVCCVLLQHCSFPGVTADSHGGYSVKQMTVGANEKPYCSFFNNRAPTPQPLLKNCSMFKENSCCLQQEIDATFGKVKPLKGSSRECQTYMNYLMCYICAPTQHMFYSRERLTVCEDFCDALYDACKSAILKGSLISHLYQNGRSFCLSRSFEVAPPTAVRCFRYYNNQDKNSAKIVQCSISMISLNVLISLLLIYSQCEDYEESVVFSKETKKLDVRTKRRLGFQNTSPCKFRFITDAILPLTLQTSYTKLLLCSIIFLFLPTNILCVRPSDVNRWANMISEDFSAFTGEGLQFDAIQKAYFDARYKTEDVDGHKKLQKVKKKLESFLSKKKQMAEDLARKVVDLYDTWSPPSPFPSSLQSLAPDVYKDADFAETIPNDMVYSSKFNVPVLINASTVKIPDDVERNDRSVIKTVLMTSKLDQLFQENAKMDPDLRWQYFGSSNGVHRQFPGIEWKSNFIGFREDFDPRMRPWYIAATSGPKDIVIILDGSSSMKENEGLLKMKNVAKTLIGTLSQQDYLNVLVSRSSYYDGKGQKQDHKPESLACKSDRLLQGSVNLRKSIIANIENLELGGGSDHREAFTNAFQLLDGPSKTGCQSIIIFITDALERDELQRCDPGYYRYDSESRRRYVPGDYCFYDYEKLIEHVDLLQNSRAEPVTIFSFVTKKEKVEFPQKLSCKNYGMVVKIKDDESTFKQMSPYFNHINQQSTARKVVWTSPYIDSSGLGLTLSAAIPVYSNKSKRNLGVIGLDATLTSIENLLQFERWGRAYAFLIDEEATAIVHPFVKPSAQLLEDMIYTNIFALETYGGKPAEFYNVVKQILHDDTGEYVIKKDAMRAVSFDNALYWRSVEYIKYLYTRIAGSGGLYLVFSLGDEDDTVRFAQPPTFHGKTIMFDLNGYLQLEAEGKLVDLVTGLNIKKNYEKYSGLYVTMAASVIQLAPRCFCHPESYLRLDEPSLFDINEEINKPSSNEPQLCPNGTFQAGVRADVHLTSIPEQKWKTRAADVQAEIVWTYIGTSSGVLRIFPGAELDKNYDTTRRPWYNIALVNRGKLAVSKVYLDASKIGKVVTFSKNIHKGPDKTPELSSCAEMPFSDGCKCTANSDCKSEFCFQNICASDHIQGVMALDLFYDRFHQKITRHLKGDDNKTVCESVYTCPYGQECRTRCYIIDGSANLVLDHAFLNVDDKDRHLYEDISLSSKHGFVFHLLLNAGIYRSYTRKDYQGVCSISNDQENRSWNSPMYSSTMNNGTGPIRRFQNKYGCVRNVMYYQINYTALNAAGGMQYGSLASDPCAMGDYYFSSIPDTNLFLLILDNYVERRTFFNFNCHIENSALIPGSMPARKNLCVTDEQNIFKNITEETCPKRRIIIDVCRISAASYIRIDFLVLAVISFALVIHN